MSMWASRRKSQSTLRATTGDPHAELVVSRCAALEGGGELQLLVTGTATVRTLMLLENNPFHRDRRVLREARALTAAGHRVVVISPGEGRRFSRSHIDGASVYQYPSSFATGSWIGFVLEYVWAMAATFAISVVASIRDGFDVIHAHNPPDVFFLIAWFHKAFGKSFVFDHHDLTPEMYEAKFGESKLVRRLLLICERLTFRASDHVISTNESYREIAIGRGRVAPEHVTVVRNGPDLGQIRASLSEVVAADSNETVIAYAGEMSDHDGVDYLLDALAALVFELGHADVRALIIGDGDAVPALKAKTADLGLVNHVRFTGWMRHDELMRLLATADIGVEPCPSNAYNDRSSMIKLTEYMALGKPIVAFDLPEHRRTAGDAALYARANDPEDMARQIEALINEPERRRRLGELGQQRIELLDWASQEPHLLKVYASLSTRSEHH